DLTGAVQERIEQRRVDARGLGALDAAAVGGRGTLRRGSLRAGVGRRRRRRLPDLGRRRRRRRSRALRTVRGILLRHGVNRRRGSRVRRRLQRRLAFVLRRRLHDGLIVLDGRLVGRQVDDLSGFGSLLFRRLAGKLQRLAARRLRRRLLGNEPKAPRLDDRIARSQRLGDELVDRRQTPFVGVGPRTLDG